MHKTTIKQKLCLISFSLIITFVILELGLRLAGSFFLFAQGNHHKINIDDEEIRILCIGESTTALGGDASYPSQLESLLNQSDIDLKFKVINKGLVAKTSKDILNQLEIDLDQHAPDIVISMIGINDKALLKVGESPGVLKQYIDDLRVIKLGKLLTEHVLARIRIGGKSSRNDGSELEVSRDRALPYSPQERGSLEYKNLQQALDILKSNQIFLLKFKKEIKETKDVKAIIDLAQRIKMLEDRQIWTHIYLAQYFRLRSDYKNAFKSLKYVEEKDPQNFPFLLEMGRCLKDIKQYKEAIFFLQKAREMNPDGILAVLELGRVYDELGWDDKVRKLCDILDEKKISTLTVYYEAGTWLKEHHYLDKAEAVFLMAIEKNPDDYRLYDEIAEVYSKKGLTEKEASYRQKSRGIKNKNDVYLDATIDNYRKIVEKVLSRDISFICMQYPLREIQPLKEIFPQALVQKIVFIEHKDDFEKALSKNQYAKVFSDNFAADFGHCTRFGNRLIAQRLVFNIYQLLENDIDFSK